MSITASFAYTKKLSSKANEAADKAAKFVAEQGYIPSVNYWSVPVIAKEAEEGVNEARSKLNSLAKKAGFSIVDKPDCSFDIFSSYNEEDTDKNFEDRRHILSVRYQINYGKTSL